MGNVRQSLEGRSRTFYPDNRHVEGRTEKSKDNLKEE